MAHQQVRVCCSAVSFFFPLRSTQWLGHIAAFERQRLLLMVITPQLQTSNLNTCFIETGAPCILSTVESGLVFYLTFPCNKMDWDLWPFLNLGRFNHFLNICLYECFACHASFHSWDAYFHSQKILKVPCKQFSNSD